MQQLTKYTKSDLNIDVYASMITISIRIDGFLKKRRYMFIDKNKAVKSFLTDINNGTFIN